MSCCAEGGQIFIFPVPGEEVSFGEMVEEGLHPIATYAGVSRTPVDAPEEPRSDDADLSRPWLALVPEPEVDEWLHRLAEHPAVAVACPNWRVSLAAPDWEVVESTAFEPGEFDRQLKALMAERESLGEGRHVAVIDSGVSPSAVDPSALNPVQLDCALLGLAREAQAQDRWVHGSVVAHLIHHLAPQARISSIRVFERGTATLAAVVFGLLSLDHLREPVDLVNLSFTVEASMEVCEHCQGVATRDQDVAGQIEAVFTRLGLILHPCPVFVAAAGGGARLASPACIPGVIAVDALAGTDPLRSARTASAEGKAEFVLAPGATKNDPMRIGTERLYGSSLATAVVTGLLASRRDELSGLRGTRLGSRERLQVQLLSELVGPEAQGYDPAKHGLGAIGLR